MERARKLSKQSRVKVKATSDDDVMVRVYKEVVVVAAILKVGTVLKCYT